MMMVAVFYSKRRVVMIGSSVTIQQLHLEDVVDIATMQRIQDTFSQAMGFAAVWAFPMARSSYCAEEAYLRVVAGRQVREA